MAKIILVQRMRDEVSERRRAEALAYEAKNTWLYHKPKTHHAHWGFICAVLAVYGGVMLFACSHG